MPHRLTEAQTILRRVVSTLDDDNYDGRHSSIIADLLKVEDTCEGGAQQIEDLKRAGKTIAEDVILDVVELLKDTRYNIVIDCSFGKKIDNTSKAVDLLENIRRQVESYRYKYAPHCETEGHDD